MRRYRWLFVLCLGLAFLPRVTRADEDNEERGQLGIVWYTMDGGGGVSRSDDIVIAGTVGQVDAGTCAVAPIFMTGGFWVPDGLSSSDEDRTFAVLPEDAGQVGLVQAAKIVDGGIEIRLGRESLAELTEIILERGAAAEGPWNRVSFERRDGGSGLVMVRPLGAADQTWYYRVQVSEPGVLMRTLGPIMIPMDTPIREFSLAPISPNPSRGATRIAWSVPRASRMQITVHDIQGRRVAVLADGAYAAGRYSVKWNAGERGGPAPGMYFVRLQSPDGVLVRRLVLAF